jgi:hypothetical protein
VLKESLPEILDRSVPDPDQHQILRVLILRRDIKMIPFMTDEVLEWKNLGTQKFKMVRLKKRINGVDTDFGDAFRKLGPIPTMAAPNPARDPGTDYLQKNQIVLNWHPKIQAIKIQFHETIKEIELRLADPAVCLQSFIISNTPSATMEKLWNMKRDKMQQRHVLFQEEDRENYVRYMFEMVGADG